MDAAEDGTNTNNSDVVYPNTPCSCSGSEDDSPAEQEVPLKEIRERLRHDLPLREWITKITGHDVRVEELITGDDEPGLGLYFRCEWCNPYDQITGRTWETEITFGEGSELLNDYVKRHNKALWTAVDRALEVNDGLDMEDLTMRYLLRITGDITKAKKTKDSQTNASEPDDDEPPAGQDEVPDDIDSQASTQKSGDRTKAELDAMFTAAGGVKESQKPSQSTAGAKRKPEVDMDAPRVRPQAVDSVTISCGPRSQKFDVAANGALVLSVDEVARAMGIVPDSDTLLYAGRYMADRRGNHFIVSQDILNAECKLTLSGNMAEVAPEANAEDAKASELTYPSPYPKGTTNEFGTPHLNVHTQFTPAYSRG